jgi:hypothetical protein
MLGWFGGTTFVQKFYAVIGLVMFVVIWKLFRRAHFHYWGIGIYLVLFIALMMWIKATWTWYVRPNSEAVMHLCITTIIMIPGSLLLGWIFHRSILSILLEQLLPGTEGRIDIVQLIVGGVACWITVICTYQLLAVNWEMMFPMIIPARRIAPHRRPQVSLLRRTGLVVRRHLYLAATVWMLLVGISLGAGFWGHPYITP